ncbi:hypothetical protein Tco_1182001 [Tanacetum coccineum]
MPSVLNWHNDEARVLRRDRFVEFWKLIYESVIRSVGCATLTVVAKVTARGILGLPCCAIGQLMPLMPEIIQLTGPEIIHETTERIVQIKSHIQAARDRQKSYADVRRKPLEFQVGDKVMLKVSPWKGVIRFGKRGKLNPRYIGPFKIIAKVGTVAYRLELPEKLSRVHSTFHVSKLKKCMADEPLAIPLDEIQVDDKLNFIEEPVEIMDREVKRLKQSRIPIVKVRWNSRRGPEFTWEREDQMQKKYPHLFTNSAPAAERHITRRQTSLSSTLPIPPSPDYTPASPDYSPASDSESDPSKDPSSDHIPPLLAISPFLSSDDDTTDSDTPDTPPSPTQDSSSEESSVFLGGSSDLLEDTHCQIHSSPDLPGTSAGPSRKRRRTLVISADVEVDPREISLRDDAIFRVSDEPHLEQDTDPEIQAEIDECIAYVDSLRDRGIDARVVVESIDREETETGVRGPVEVGAVEATYETLGDLVQRFHDHTQAIPVHRIQAIEGVQREQGHRIVGVESAVIALTERIAELERDNMRLRGTMSVESQRVDRLQRGMSRKMPSTRSGASMTREEFEELVTRRVAEEMEAREAARTLEPLNENGDELEGENGGNGNGGNGGNGNGGNGGNGNRNGNHGMNYGGFMPVARECTFQDFLKCKPHNFSGTEGVVGLTRWFEKMETVFNISNCPSKYQVKYATCTLQDSALTWWNSHKRTIGVEAAYAMNWVELMKLMTEVYMSRNEHPERWRLNCGVAREGKRTWTAYNSKGCYAEIQPDHMMLLRTATNYGSRRFRVMLQGVLRIRGGGWPVTKGITCVTAKPTVKEAKILVGQNVARAYYGIGTNDKKGKIGHQTRDCRNAIVPNTQRAPIGNQQSIICYESWKTGHFSEDCPKNFRTKYVSLEVCTLGDYCLSSIDPNADELGSFDVIFEEKDLRMCQSYRIPKFFQKICLELPAARQVNVNRLMSLAAALLARLGTFTLDTAKDLRQLKDWGHKTHRDSSILRQKCIPVVESKSCVGADFDVQEGMRTSLVYCDASHNRLGRGFDAKRECHSLRIPPTQEELNMRQSVGLKLLSDYDVRSDIHPGKAKRGLTFLKQILSAQSEAERKRTYQEDLRGMINKLETSRGRNAMLNIEVGFRVLGDFEALIMHESHKSHLHQEDDGRSERTFDVRDMLRACVLDLEKVGLTLTIGRSFRITTVTLPAIKAASLRALKPVEIIKPCGQASGEESYSIVMVRGNSKERLRPCFEEQSFFKGEECDNPEDSSV